MATKKGSKGKGKTKKSASKKADAKKKGAKKSGAKKGAAKKASKKMVAAVAETAAVCTLTAMSTTDLVANCAPGASNIGVTLQAAGLINQGQRDNFGDCVFQSVLAAGCLINRGAIPTGANTTLRDVVFAVLGAI
jgi:hypothetical protein